MNDLHAESFSVPPNQIALTIPGLTPAAPQIADDMSNEFQQITVFTLVEVREWRGTATRKPSPKKRQRLACHLHFPLFF